MDHAVAIAIPQITSEQIFTQTADPAAALVDAWGCAHGIAHGTRIGRDRERNEIAVLHASVSAEHAAFEHAHGKWCVIDRASRNGTEVDGVVVREQRLVGGETIRFGDVSFYFWSKPLSAASAPRGHGRTARARGVEPYRVRATTAVGEPVELVQRVDEGFLRIGDTTIDLGTKEIALLRLLIERRRQSLDPEFAYVGWHEIADALAFRSIDSNSENVRELVHRVRRKTRPALIESRRGVGYRIAIDL